MDSKLQIISGIYRGRKLDLPRGARPTQNRARIALFNMLESGIIQPNDKIKVWDTFAGSGAFGIECLSRYPNAVATFTDIANDSIKTVRNNLNKVDVGVRANVIQHDAINAVQKIGADVDLVFLDPPYDCIFNDYGNVDMINGFDEAEHHPFAFSSDDIIHKEILFHESARLE